MNNKLTYAFYAFGSIGAGALVNYLGDMLLGIRLEHYFGVYTFSPLWIVDLFAVPFVAGIVVSAIYGLGGKLLCYFAPVVVRGASYLEAMYVSGPPEGGTILPFAFWILILIVAIESAAFGGVFGEILVKRTYGRRPRHLVYKDKSDPGT